MSSTSIDLPPTFLSSLVMLAVLPATLLFKEREACDLSFVNSDNYDEDFEQARQEIKSLENNYILVMEEWTSRNDEIRRIKNIEGQASNVQRLESEATELHETLSKLSNDIKIRLFRSEVQQWRLKETCKLHF